MTFFSSSLRFGFSRKQRQSHGRRELRTRRITFETLENRRLLSVTAQILNDINPGATQSTGGTFAGFENVGGTAYFAANDGIHGNELWKTDGTEAGTVMVKDIRAGDDSTNSYPREFINVDGTLFFSAFDGLTGRELWKSDGTAAGTVRVKDIRVGGGDSSPQQMSNFNGTLYFSADDGTHGLELWKSDGTEAGTVLVKDLRQVPDSMNTAISFH